MQQIDKLITTLGIGNYKVATYRLHENEELVVTPFFPVAVVRWFRPKEVHVLLTGTARKHENWLHCRTALADLMPAENIHEARIPDGKSEQELWQIFGAIEAIVSSGDKVVMDITHSFRSLPMLSLLVIAYLRQVKGVQVERILYGAFDAQDAQGVAPVFDLTPFVSLLDWLTAAKIFMETGDGRELANLMRNAQADAHKAGRPKSPRMLIPASEKIKQVSESLLTNRIPALAPAVQGLETVLAQPQTENEVATWLPPLVPLLRQIGQAYKPFSENSLRAQAELIAWYAERGHTLHALTLAREWLISHELEQNEGDLLDLEAREAVNKQFNDRTEAGEKTPVVEAWQLLSGLRNDIAHCGFRKDFATTHTLRQAAERAYEIISQILRSENAERNI